MRRLLLVSIVFVGCRAGASGPPASALLVAPPAPTPVVDRAASPADPERGADASFPPLPAGATVSVFRDLLVGAMPSPARRRTWTLAVAGKRIALCLVSERANRDFEHVDAASTDDTRFGDAVRTAWDGELAIADAPAAVELRRVFGPEGTIAEGDHAPPAVVRLQCSARTIVVHPYGAALRPGHKRNDDTMTRARWEPAVTTSLAGVTRCTPDEGTNDVLFSFTEAMAFAPTAKGAVEWAFDDSDMIVQEGGYRFLAR